MPSEPLASRVEAAVRRIEIETCAEVVVVLAARSSRYSAAAWAAGASAAWGTLVFLAWSPWVFNAFWFPVDVVVVGGIVGFVVARSDPAKRLLTPRAALVGRAEEAARAAFLDEAVHGTTGRTGVLVYVSRLEDHVVVLPDDVLLARVPRPKWDEVRFAGAGDDAVIDGLDHLGRCLAGWLPPGEENRDEIPDAPRVRT